MEYYDVIITEDELRLSKIPDVYINKKINRHLPLMYKIVKISSTTISSNKLEMTFRLGITRLMDKNQYLLF
jgi:hypothetical protein